uniref:Selenoprotein P N-terminal domain-containing protein n=1 Tax=Denticeps clupeoides TaxID=299321 RepID=A0AAY4AAJ0_9TELE
MFIRLGSLRDKLARRRVTDVSFLIVNEQEALSRAMYWELKRRTAAAIPVYQQSPMQEDVWEALEGDKDDFLVYDRCGRLTFHIVLPYSYLHFPYVEAAILATYFKDICGNCSVQSSMKNATASKISTDAQPHNKKEEAGDATHTHHMPHDVHVHQSVSKVKTDIHRHTQK